MMAWRFAAGVSPVRTSAHGYVVALAGLERRLNFCERLFQVLVDVVAQRLQRRDV